MVELYEARAWELREMLRRREVSAVEILRAVRERVREVEERVRSYITLTLDEAERAALEADAALAEGRDPGPAAGIPMAVKDVLCTRGILTTCGSRILENYVPVYDATVIGRLRRDGLTMVGKANMDEFAMGSSTENSAFGPTRNPWDLERVPGGSSGGSAAAVAAGEAIWALGSDTGGSIRQPASFCGLVGLKPTYGLVSRFGLVAFASSLDQVGPITRDVRDCALLLSLIAGHDPRDSTSLQVEVPDYLKAMEGGIEGMRVGVPRELMQEGLTPGVRECMERCLAIFQELGAEVEEAGLPHLDYALSAYYIIAPAEASSNLARYDGVRYGLRVEGEDMLEMYGKTRARGFGAEVKRRIMLGTYALSAGYYEAYYGQAQKVRTLILGDFRKAFERYDVLVSPTSPTPAFRLGEKVEDPLAMYLSDVCTIPVNLAGIPAVSIPCGLEDGLPVGLQIMGKVLDEATLLRVARAMEEAIGFRERPPAGRGVG
ncbi:Asp-tRNA(Asn)/Glu-tRNA(Gln) amidotransferase subunit GatA [Candidatus Solincola tengchongensis]|uniref:Asp-tRNA(Asn)/Glu-tRNA(Gln) amidotransferase subunit GatA n=1 Tax=Candidatus Solincola tengchongensis TaxID=2900693 RepID=UPI00257E504E|nr:Asp-tRNA(Asn)/Glu-tRNA(Gln) amidotransferase subunit GatA [Candidatus Solincola tengchongensis]